MNTEHDTHTREQEAKQGSLRTCVSADGTFRFGIHRPQFHVANLRCADAPAMLGLDAENCAVGNKANFPAADVTIDKADWVYEIPNPFPFRGTTFISRAWADRKADNPGSIRLPGRTQCSMTEAIRKISGDCSTSKDCDPQRAFCFLPQPVLLCLAANSTDPEDLIVLAGMSCELLLDPRSGAPVGIRYRKDADGYRPVITNHDLFEVVVNNPALPDKFKDAMVLKPGVQGGSEIVGDFLSEEGATRIFEYLRTNSYIPWGHYASNMANDSIRYAAQDISPTDMQGLRHLYYQRTYIRMAEILGCKLPMKKGAVSAHDLEAQRLTITDALKNYSGRLPFNTTLWGWNFGFDFSGSGYRLHASHQQVHQQYALVPPDVPAAENNASLPSFSSGDMIAEFCAEFKTWTGADFFAAYEKAIRSNRRTDGRTDKPASLIVHEDEHVLLFVPKGQTSQWELQIMPTAPIGNILEASSPVRAALDRALLIAQHTLAAMGARMVTSIEFPKRFDAGDTGQRLLYALLPKLPYSMGAFSEAQLRWINGHYPEDFAAACRLCLTERMPLK